MINREATIRWKGYDPSDLCVGSHKRVWATCGKCGRGRWISKRRAHRACAHCSPCGGGTHTEEGKAILSDIAKKRVGTLNPNWRGGNVTKICPVCGTSFVIPPHDQNRRKCCSRKCSAIAHRSRMAGEQNPAWMGGVAPEASLFRTSTDYAMWRQSVFERDAFTCQECNRHGGNLNAHHIVPYNDWKDSQYSLNLMNGITLCEQCHRKTYSREYEFFSKYFDIANGVGI